MPSKESTRPLPQKPSPGKGPKVMMPEVKASSIAGPDNRILLVPHEPLISCVGIKAKYGKARLRDAEVSLQSSLEEAELAEDQFARES